MVLTGVVRRGRRASQGRRDDVLDTARQLFSDRGYDGFQMSSVASQAGVPKSWLYGHYTDRRALLRAVVEEDVDELVGRMTSALKPGEDLDTLLRQGLDIFLAFVEERRTGYKMLFGLPARLEPDVAVVVRDLRERLANLFLRIYRRAIENA